MKPFSLLIASVLLCATGCVGVAGEPPVPTTTPAGRSSALPGTTTLGIGFLIGKDTAKITPLLAAENDFLEMVLGPDKVSSIQALRPPARAMCISLSLQGIAGAVAILKEAGVPPERVLIAYNPELRQTQAVTPPEELADLPGSILQARRLLADYPAQLVVGPGLSQMQRQEDLYPELARCCDAWMIQSQSLQLDPQSGLPVTPGEYRRQVQRIVDLLRRGNPQVRVYVQIIPGAWTHQATVNFTAELTVSYLEAVADLVVGAALYGGDAALISDIIRRLRGGEVHG